MRAAGGLSAQSQPRCSKWPSHRWTYKNAFNRLKEQRKILTHRLYYFCSLCEYQECVVVCVHHISNRHAVKPNCSMYCCIFFFFLMYHHVNGCIFHICKQHLHFFEMCDRVGSIYLLACEAICQLAVNHADAM